MSSSLDNHASRSAAEVFPSLQSLRRKFGIARTINSICADFTGEMRAVDDKLRHCCQCEEQPLIEDVANYIISSGGKRIRPLLVFLSARLCGAKVMELVPMASAIELMHTATLLHDDVVDVSSLRRGKPSAAVKWSNSLSVLVGDYLLSQSFELMVSCGSLSSLSLLSRTSAIISRGEVTQLRNIRNLAITLQVYESIIAAKTGALFSAATEIAAILCEVDEGKRKALKSFGYYLGMTFQVVDDVLDFTAKDGSFGKKAGMDLKEGKITLPVLYAYNRADASLRSDIESCIKGVDSSDALINRVIDKVALSSAIGDCFDYANKMANKAASALSVFDSNSTRDTLLRLLEFTTHRTY